MNITEQPHSFKNRTEINESSVCGCYYCLAMFTPNTITEWTDNDLTALCPFCGIDSVVGSQNTSIDINTLQLLKEKWFSVPPKQNSFILNVSYMDFKLGNHRDPGENSIAIQILSKSQCDFEYNKKTEWPVSPFSFKEVHRFNIDDNHEEDCIDDIDVEKIVGLLKRAKDNNMNVVVHCAAGVCRSGAVCCAGKILGFEYNPDYNSPNQVIMGKLVTYIISKQMYSIKSTTE